jgi:thiol-disulfide isomerase/thioredoxin
MPKLASITADASRTTAIASAVLLFAVLVVDHERSARELARTVAEIDTLRNRIMVSRANQDSVLAPGDLLPNVPVESGDVTTSLRELASDHSFVYFSRDDCLPCQILQPLLTGLSRTAKAKIIVVSMTPSDAGVIDSTIASARLQQRGTLGKSVQGIPTLVHVDRDGTVLSVAHASLPRTMRMLVAFRLAAGAHVDSVVTEELTARSIPLAAIGQANPSAQDATQKR